MSISTSPSVSSRRRLTRTQPTIPAQRRVRHEVRDGVAVVLFSAPASTALAGAMLLLMTFAGQGA